MTTSTNNKPLRNKTADKSTADEQAAQRVVFFDGVCGLCNRTINFLMRCDRKALLRFAPLQGSTAKSIVPDDVREELSTFVYARNGQLFFRSTAMLRILRDLGGAIGVAAAVLSIVPAPLRDLVYRTVASVRYRVFGKSDACRLPTPEERSRFLD